MAKILRLFAAEIKENRQKDDHEQYNPENNFADGVEVSMSWQELFADTFVVSLKCVRDLLFSPAARTKVADQ